MENVSFGSRLKNLRNEKNLTQKELSDLLHVSRSNISKYEQDSQFPDLSTLHQICDIFNVSMDYLLCKADYRNVDELIDETAEQLIHAFEKAGIRKEEINLEILDKVLDIYKIINR